MRVRSLSLFYLFSSSTTFSLNLVLETMQLLKYYKTLFLCMTSFQTFFFFFIFSSFFFFFCCFALSFKIFLSVTLAWKETVGFDLTMLQYKGNMTWCEYWYRREVLPETDSNHEKSEVKVVFIRNGFHTTLLHKTKQSVHLELYSKKMDHVKTDRVTISKIIDFFICPNVYNISGNIVLLAGNLLTKKTQKWTSNIHTHTV